MRNFIANALEIRLYIIRYALAPGAHPTKEISLKFEIRLNTFVYIFFCTYPITNELCTFKDSCAVL